MGKISAKLVCQICRQEIPPNVAVKCTKCGKQVHEDCTGVVNDSIRYGKTIFACEDKILCNKCRLNRLDTELSTHFIDINIRLKAIENSIEAIHRRHEVIAQECEDVVRDYVKSERNPRRFSENVPNRSANMSKRLESFRKEINRFWSLRRQIDWLDLEFSPEKAYVMSIFSKIAYLELPEYELNHHRFAKIIPCLTYQELLARGTHLNTEDFLRSADFGNSFVVVTKYMVAVVTITQDVIIIALRGTRPLYLSDWIIDFHVTRTNATVNTRKVTFHSGFYLAITDCIERIATEIHNRTKNSLAVPPIYVVGHSLGGALAAIVRALDGTTFHSKYRYGSDLTFNIKSHSSYSFGMPRYGDTGAVECLKSPFHVYNDSDIVPGVPPRWMGFDNAPNEYCLSEGGSLDSMHQNQQGLKWWCSRKIRYHFIEHYIERLGIAIGIY